MSDEREVVANVTAIVDRLTEARVSSLRLRAQVSIHRHFGKGPTGHVLSAEWYARDGRLFVYRRGRNVAAPGATAVHEFLSEETTVDEAAGTFLRLGVPAERLHVGPAASLVFAPDAPP